MNRSSRLAILGFCALLTACETTGDPRQGGLFGWSESKAQDRQVQKRSAVTEAEGALSREDEKTAALQARKTSADRNVAVAREKQAREQSLKLQRDRAKERDLEASLNDSVARLEKESTTEAAASRARSYRRKATAISRDTALSVEQRMKEMQRLKWEIDGLLR